MLWLGITAAAMNSSLGLVAITVMWTHPATAWAAAVPPIVLYMSFRAYVAQLKDHRYVRALFEATKAMYRSTQIKDMLVTAADHARVMFEAEQVQIAVLPGGIDEVAYRTAVGPGDGLVTMERFSPDVDGAWVETLLSGESRLVRRGSDRRWRGSNDEVVAAIPGPVGPLGVISVSEPVGDVRTFTPTDLRFLNTLAAQIGVSLENGRLEDSLRQVTRLKDDLRHEARHDVLTGLANRKLLREKLGAATQRVGTDEEAVLLFLDLDDFKHVNDTLGHAGGDQLLVSVAQRLQSTCRPDDTIARMGGDEFAILLRNTSRDQANGVAERIGQILEPPFMVAGRRVRVGASIGVAAVQSGYSPDELLGFADRAMYSAKRQGKGTYQIFID